MQTLKAGATYFALVFAAGFVLGAVRVIWVVPRVGTRTAELMEAPFMLLIVVIAAWWVVRHHSLPTLPMTRLSVGFIALSFMLLAEFTVVVAVRHLTLSQYLAGRDPVAGSVYILMLLAFAAMPLFIARK